MSNPFRLLLAVMLVGTLSTQTASAFGSVYRCEDGREFLAEFDDGGVVLSIGVEVIELPSVQAGSGERYEDDVFLFWVRGDEATYAVKGELETVCRVIEE